MGFVKRLCAKIARQLNGQYDSKNDFLYLDKCIIKLTKKTGWVLVEYGKNKDLLNSFIVHYPSEDVVNEGELAAEIISQIKEED